jgi:hypothetical protein
LKLRARYSSSKSQLCLNALGVGDERVVRTAVRAQRRMRGSAASMPDLIAQWLPLMREAFRKPASSPIRQPPGNTSSGSDCRPPAAIARAP